MLPREHNKTLVELASLVPGAQRQALHHFVHDPPWDAEALNRRRLQVWQAHPFLGPHPDGVLIVDETGDPKRGHWIELAWTPIQEAHAAGIPFRLVVADCVYGESSHLEAHLVSAGIPYIMGLRPSHGTWQLVMLAFTFSLLVEAVPRSEAAVPIAPPFSAPSVTAAGKKISGITTDHTRQRVRGAGRVDRHPASGAQLALPVGSAAGVLATLVEQRPSARTGRAPRPSRSLSSS